MSVLKVGVGVCLELCDAGPLNFSTEKEVPTSEKGTSTVRVTRRKTDIVDYYEVWICSFHTRCQVKIYQVRGAYIHTAHCLYIASAGIQCAFAIPVMHVPQSNTFLAVRSTVRWARAGSWQSTSIHIFLPLYSVKPGGSH